MLAITLSPNTVAIITGAVIPLLVALVTKWNASPLLKGFVNLVLTGIASLIIQATVPEGQAVITQDLLVTWFITFATSVATYFGVYRSAEVNQKLAPTVGIGPKE